MLLQNLTIILLTVIEFVNSILIPFLNNYIFEGFIIISIIYLASGSRAAKVLDVGAKLIGSAAGSTFLYNYWIKGSSSLPTNEEDKDKSKENKTTNKETINNQGTSGK